MTIGGIQRPTSTHSHKTRTLTRCWQLKRCHGALLETMKCWQWQCPRPINPCWTRATEGCLHSGIRKVVVGVGMLSATHPWMAVILSVVISIGLLVTGVFTNFYMELNQLYFVTPTNSLPDIHSKWIRNANTIAAANSGFPNVRIFFLNIHDNGHNVLRAQAMETAFETMEVIQTTPNYADLCATCSDCSESEREMLFDGTSYCRISSVTQFWDHSLESFQLQMRRTSSDLDHYGTLFLEGILRLDSNCVC